MGGSVGLSSIAGRSSSSAADFEADKYVPMLPELPYFGSIGALSVNTYIVSYKLRRQRKGHFVVDDGLKLVIYTDFEYCRRRIRLFFGDDDVFLKEIYCVAISIALFRISNTYDGTDIVNNQQFNKSRLRHVTQATFVKSLIDWKISPHRP